MGSKFPYYAHRASAGRRSRRTWGLGSGHCFGTPERVPKFRKGFLERERGVSRNSASILLDGQFDFLPLRTAAFIEPMECLAVPKVPGGSELVYEIKLDGYRARWPAKSN